MRDSLEVLLAEQSMAKQLNTDRVIEIGDRSFQLLPNGARNYRFILHCDDFELKIQNFYSEKASNYPLYVKVKSSFLWQRKDQAYYDILQFLQDSFGAVLDVKVSRVDLCCHTDQCDIDRLKIEYFVTRSKSHVLHYNNKHLSGITFGKSPIMCRIYDKELEIEQASKKTWFYDLWDFNRDGRVYNVEFQLSREILKEMKIDTYEQLLFNMRDLWLYLTCEWLVQKDLDATRIERCTTSEFWQGVQHAFDDYPSGDGITREKQLQSSEEYILNMLAAYMINHAAFVRQPDFYSYVQQSLAHVWYHLENKGIDFEKAVLEKMALRGL
jgi:hypothetical protein